MKHFLGEEADDEDGDEDEESDEDIEWEAVRATTVIQAEKGSKSDAEGVVDGASKVKDKKKRTRLTVSWRSSGPNPSRDSRWWIEGFPGSVLYSCG
jgi:hypothetical protein